MLCGAELKIMSGMPQRNGNAKIKELKLLLVVDFQIQHGRAAALCFLLTQAI